MESKSETTQPVATAERGGCSTAPDGSAQTPQFTLTPKEELAVIVQRLKAHEEDAMDEKCRVRLDIAADQIRRAMIWR